MNRFPWYRRWLGVAFLSLLLAPQALLGQNPAPTAPTLDGALIKSTVESAADLIHREYFDPELAARIDIALRQRLAEGRYADLVTPAALARSLTVDLASLSHDRHLVVTALPGNISGPYAGPGATPQSREEAVDASNGGVGRVEIFPGNLGYLNITSFLRPAEAGGAIAEAMHTLRNADALILDLRDNAGGSPDTVALLASYFFDGPELPLFDIIPRYGEAQHYTTQAGLADRDRTRPVYVLISAQTWSVGEALPYILQERHRAEIVGEISKGAANPGKPYPLNAAFSITIPNEQLRSAVRGSNWEGTGVFPDTPTHATEALQVARVLALRRLLSETMLGPRHDQLRDDLGKLTVPQSR